MREIYYLEESIKKYKSINRHRSSGRYAFLMFDISSYECFVEEHWDPTFNAYTSYTSEFIRCLSDGVAEEGMSVTADNIKKYIEECAEEWEEFVNRRR